jgi:hypothetical protein
MFLSQLGRARTGRCAVRARGGGDAGSSSQHAGEAAQAPSPGHAPVASPDYSASPSYNPTPPDAGLVQHDEWYDSSNASEVPREPYVDSAEERETRAAEQRAHTEWLLAEAARRLEAMEMARRAAAEEEVERQEEEDEQAERWWSWCVPGAVAWARTATNGSALDGVPRGPWRRVTVTWVQDQRKLVMDRRATLSTGRPVCDSGAATSSSS